MIQVNSSLAKKRSKEANKARVLAPVKFCGGCEKTKDKSEFGRDHSHVDGLRSCCKECHNARQKKWLSDPDNREKFNKMLLDWGKRNPEKVAEKRARFLARMPATYIANKSKEWREKNPERARDRAKRAVNKYRSTAIGALNTRVRNSVYACLRSNKNGKTFDLLDFTIAELKLHIERQFTNGMGWAAFIRGEIHLDHIRPLAEFVFDSPDSPQFKQAWALTNLQPLWAKDNLTKNAKRLYLL